MNETNFASDVTKTFTDAGSFYIDNFKGKNREQAKTFVAAGLSTSLENNLKNVVHNLKSDADFNYECSNYTFSFTEKEISYFILNDKKAMRIKANLPILITDISVEVEGNKAIELVPGFHFYQEKDNNTSSQTYGQFISIVIMEPEVWDKFVHKKEIRFIIQGRYNQYAIIKNSLMSSLLGVGLIPVGDGINFIADYLVGDNQSVLNFENVLNALYENVYLKQANYKIYSKRNDIDSNISIVILRKLDLNTSKVLGSKIFTFNRSLKNDYITPYIYNDSFLIKKFRVEVRTPNTADRPRDMFLSIDNNDTDNLTQLKEIAQVAKQLLPIGYQLNIAWTRTI